MSAITNNPITNASGAINTTIYKCRRYRGFFPNTNPGIYFLSTDSSSQGVYTIVNITGYNFFPFDITKVNFGNYKNINVLFLSGNSISFEVPINAPAGLYNIQVTNNSSSITNSHLIYSNIVSYKII